MKIIFYFIFIYFRKLGYLPLKEIFFSISITPSDDNGKIDNSNPDIGIINISSDNTNINEPLQINKWMVITNSGRAFYTDNAKSFWNNFGSIKEWKSVTSLQFMTISDKITTEIVGYSIILSTNKFQRILCCLVSFYFHLIT